MRTTGTQRSRRIDLHLGENTTAAWIHPRESNRRPLLMIHGFRGDHHGMDRIAGAVGDRDVIVPDLPGFGLSAPLAGGLSLESYVGYLTALRAEVARRWQRPPVLLGHSFGSILVSHLAAQLAAAGSEAAEAAEFEQALTELILINPITTPALEGSARFLTGLTRIYYGLGARLPESMGHQLLANPLIVRMMSEVMATTKDRGLRRYIHDQHAKHFSTFSDRAALAEAFDTSVSHTVTEVVAELTMPTLVIAGDRDAIAPIGPTRDFVAKLADPEFLELGGVGHLVHYERPEAAASAIMEFSRGRD